MGWSRVGGKRRRGDGLQLVIFFPLSLWGFLRKAFGDGQDIPGGRGEEGEAVHTGSLCPCLAWASGQVKSSHAERETYALLLQLQFPCL